MCIKFPQISLLLILFLTLAGSSSLLAQTEAEPDSNFYIFLAFGQSNMEGAGAIEEQDQTVDPRFQVYQAVDCNNLNRTKGSWYDAIPPLTRCYSGLSPADYFGRTMVEYTADSIRVGIINVSVAGTKIELFDKANFQTYLDSQTEEWFLNIVAEYNNNPYQYLVDLANEAQKDGVIKGILLHQGESNGGDTQWPQKVKTIYDSLMVDLSLDPTKIPLLAGELVHADQGGAVSGMNSIIGTLPQTLPNSYVISSSGCTDQADNLHFTSAGYRRLGTRYGAKMLELLGYDVEVTEEPDGPVNSFQQFFEVECASPGANWDIVESSDASNGRYITAKAGFEQTDGPPTSDDGTLSITFTADTAGYFKLLGRMNNPSYNDDSFWVKMDDGDYQEPNGLVTSGWQWVNIGSYKLEKGEHTLVIGFREDGATLDKIAITNYEQLPSGFGDLALNACEFTSNETITETPGDFTLSQNYPNPFNPQTVISYQLPLTSTVKLSVFDMAGRELAVLVDSKQSAGTHEITFDASKLATGTYIYRLVTPAGTISRKMLLMK